MHPLLDVADQRDCSHTVINSSNYCENASTRHFPNVGFVINAKFSHCRLAESTTVKTSSILCSFRVCRGHTSYYSVHLRTSLVTKALQHDIDD